ncbi:hypothetical protein HN859_01335 [Candidatus Parcubacteria bacterium]|jgi:hypothetical protein|nr:hypothetical protein [Candidatus Parcubacteria bacterium]
MKDKICKQYRDLLASIKSDKVIYDSGLEEDLKSGDLSNSVVLKKMLRHSIDHGKGELDRETFILSVIARRALMVEGKFADGSQDDTILGEEGIRETIKRVDGRIRVAERIKTAKLTFSDTTTDFSRPIKNLFLPDNLYVKGQLDLSGMNTLLELPKGLEADSLIITDKIKKLPNDLIVNNYIDIIIVDAGGNEVVPVLQQARKLKEAGNIKRIRVNGMLDI